MEGWLSGMQAMLDSIEQHLTEEIDIRDLARLVGVSPFYCQRIFGALCNMTLGEYIRARRLSQAGQDLSRGNMRVLDTAVLYGYESADSFARAFQHFHGISPSQAREAGAALRYLAPLHIKISLEGGTMLDYRIVELAPFTVMGKRQHFHSETSYQEIPKFWDAWASEEKRVPELGIFGVCIDSDGADFDYLIADLYKPWEEVPEGCETFVLPGGLWAQFVCKGPLPDSLQQVNTQIWREWLPGLKDYALAGNYSVEVYDKPADNPEDTLSYIWIPLRRL